MLLLRTALAVVVGSLIVLAVLLGRVVVYGTDVLLGRVVVYDMLKDVLLGRVVVYRLLAEDC